MNWKKEILEAYNAGRTIQCNMPSGNWHDFVPQNQLDNPNLEYGNVQNWRIKATTHEEREQILKASGRDEVTPMMKEEQPWEEKHYSKEEMLLFAGFCVGRKRINPGLSGHDLWEAWEADFGHE